MDNSLVKYKEVIDIIDKYQHDLSEKQIEALPYMAANVDLTKIANILGVSRATISKWRREVPAFMDAVRDMRALQVGHTDQSLAKVAIRAYDVLWEIVSQDYSQANDKERRIIADTAKFIVGKINSDKIDTTVTHQLEDPNINISEQSIDILARRVHQLSSQGGAESISREYNVAEGDFRYAIHPEARYGVLLKDQATGKSMCHICGEWVDDVPEHSAGLHRVSAEQYSEISGVELKWLKQ